MGQNENEAGKVIAALLSTREKITQKLIEQISKGNLTLVPRKLTLRGAPQLRGHRQSACNKNRCRWTYAQEVTATLLERGARTHPTWSGGPVRIPSHVVTAPLVRLPIEVRVFSEKIMAPRFVLDCFSGL